ncbi:MAG TPA: hypothetical protein VMA71_10230 [Alloacidobacterium sp.]|nr:hypothetical protein [Alloacidobacterium sp.]
MFRELAREGEKPATLTPADICEGVGIEANQDNLDNMRSLKNRLNADLANFFDYGEGRLQKWRVYFEHKDYRPHFRSNTPPTQEIDYLAQFWAPHRQSSNPTHILYPEPCFFIDSQRTYLRNPDANRPEDRERFSYLLTDWTKLKTTYSYVPSGAVKAMLCIMACFRQWDQEITPKAFLPHDRVPDAPNLIVLGTSTSMQAVATLERSLPIHTGLKHVTIDGEDPVEDTEYDEQGEMMYRKWGTLTRRWHRFPDRIVTVISAHHGRAVDAIASFLTTPLSLSTLAEYLKSPRTFPASFQALFSVEMEETSTGPHTTYTAVDRALDIRDHLASTR